MKTSITALAVFLSSFILHPSSFAQTTRPTLSATLGFANSFKPDNWTPIYARISDAAAPRPATLEIRTARGKLGHDVIARIVTTRMPTTYTLYAPVGYLDKLSLQLRDDAGRLLRSIDLTETAAATPAALGGPVIGAAGPDADAQRVASQITMATGEYAASGALSPSLLPERAIGYSGVDCLVLSALDSDVMDQDVQRAIIAWIRSGGILVTWPGAVAPTSDSPLTALLPGEIGEPAEIEFDGQGIVGRRMSERQNILDAVELAPEAIFSRRVGLGQVVQLAFDPTRLTSTPEVRISLWRKLTGGQLALLPDDRRAGVFDSLTTQAVAEQQLKVSPPPVKSWAMTLVRLGLLTGLLLGPGELILLAAAGRQPRTWYTLAGVGLCVSCGILWVPLATTKPRIFWPGIDVRVESPDGLDASIRLSQQANATFETNWLTADRSDPALQPATELMLGQRADRIDVMGYSNLGNATANFRAIRFSGAVLHPVELNVDLAASRVVNASKSNWASVAWIDRDGVRLAAGPVAPGDAASLANVPIVPTDNPSTRRVETGIERLAAEPDWAAILLDRRLSERLVRLLEVEPSTVIVATRGASGTAFTLQVIRP
jgi:hypothetical protein